MAIAVALKSVIEEIIDTIINTTSVGRGKRQLSEMFMDLVDKDSWPEYYDVIPDPRCISGVQDKLSKNKYKDALDVYADLSLVFLNALFYNEDGSQISKDAATLKSILETEWKKHTVLPTPPTTPPPSTPKKPVASTSAVPNPAVQQPTVPAASASTPVPPLRTSAYKPPQSPSSPDMDIDIGGGSPEPEGVIEDMTRDAESDEIVKQLERSLPGWEGFGDRGWMSETHADRYLDIVLAIKSHKDVIGNRVAAAFDTIPEESTGKNLSFNYPLSLKTIEARVRAKSYDSAKEFDMEFARLFEKGRRWYEIGSEQYGSVLLLQRLYQALISPSPPPGPPYSSQTNFASLRAGPGTARPLHAAGEMDGVPGVTTFRVSSKDRQFVDEVDYRGYSVHLADWLHLANPDDPSRPIVAQVFKCWVSDEVSKKGQPGVTVCWYYRPEQTVHPAHRQFWEGEVFKTGHFADHPLDDIIEKIACQFTARHIRGRPRPPFWYPGWPLYVCDSRYNDRERVFVKIKNWNSCVPEEVRKSTEFMPIYPFERTVFPRRFGSPFLTKAKNSRGAKFPGGIGDSVERADGEKIEGGGTGRKRPRRTGGASTPKASRTDDVGPSKGLYVGASTPGAPSNQTTSNFPQSTLQSQQQVQSRRNEDRSITTAAGGLVGLGGNIVQEKLPPETAKHFDRDPETNEVLWFSGPPIDVARTPAPQYSLNYLHHLAMKRKQATQEADGSARQNGHDTQSKRQRFEPHRTVTETIQSLLANFQED